MMQFRRAADIYSLQIYQTIQMNQLLLRDLFIYCRTVLMYVLLLV